MEEKTSSIQKTARIAAVLTLLIVVFAPFSMLYVPSTLIVPGDAGATVSRIMASDGLFRLGIASDSLVFLIEIALTVLLYQLLKPVNRTFSLIAAFARLAMTIVQGINLFNYFFVLLLLSGATYLSVFVPDQLHALVMLFLNVHQSGILIWGLFFGLHLLTYGYLVYKSGYLPKWLGILLLVVSFSYLGEGFGNILFPQSKEIISFISSLSMLEIIFPLWLLIKGVNVEQWKKRSTDLQ